MFGRAKLARRVGAPAVSSRADRYPQLLNLIRPLPPPLPPPIAPHPSP